MNIFKFGRDEFFGIIIPGAFLVINIIVFFPLSKIGINILKMNLNNKEGVIITALFIISYIIGFALRLIKPDYIEWLSFLCRITLCSIYESIKGSNSKGSESYFSILGKKLKEDRESFPYIDRLYDSHLLKTPTSIRLFFNDVLEKEFSGNRDLMKNQTFINQCKLFVRNKSHSLNEEIMYCEGLVRFLSGMSYVLILNIVLLMIYLPKTLIILYIILAIIFIRNLQPIRWREVATIFHAYAILK